MPAVPFSAGVQLPSPIYVDASVAIAFLYKTHPHNVAAVTFVLESLKQTRQLLFSTLAMDELWHQLMSLWHKEATSQKFYSNKPAHVARWSAQVKQITDSLFRISNVQHCPSHPGGTVVPLALTALQTCNLGARDAFHLARMNAAGISAIATLDADFDMVLPIQPGITIVKVA